MNVGSLKSEFANISFIYSGGHIPNISLQSSFLGTYLNGHGHDNLAANTEDISLAGTSSMLQNSAQSEGKESISSA